MTLNYKVPNELNKCPFPAGADTVKINLNIIFVVKHLVDCVPSAVSLRRHDVIREVPVDISFHSRNNTTLQSL